MRKPRMKKLPRKPKRMANLETVKRYLARVKEITRENKKKLSDYLKTQKLINKIHSK